ncbi:MAG: DUF1501 domain-containing protein, partial [Armatimonadetes bacterium]|nr:DUF1501 domain-containing protein [Armatimonadota bacterium]
MPGLCPARGPTAASGPGRRRSATRRRPYDPGGVVPPAPGSRRAGVPGHSSFRHSSCRPGPDPPGRSESRRVLRRGPPARPSRSTAGVPGSPGAAPPAFDLHLFCSSWSRSRGQPGTHSVTVWTQRRGGGLHGQAPRALRVHQAGPLEPGPQLPDQLGRVPAGLHATRAPERCQGDGGERTRERMRRDPGRGRMGCDGITRREMLRIGGLGLSGLTLPTLLAARTAAASGAAGSTFGKARSCLLLYLVGGPPQHETWDPKPEASTEVRGAFGALSTPVAGLQVGELMPKLGALAARYAVIRSMATDVNAHTGSG